ncbi:hypothetical protein [Paractinoplanes toevensis]|uniref:hypothetical protein n=1 Tax=Paractinoplanes toevensis TaxID=571911 RepID=UPI001BB45C2D|nr:hypothetical protein [Actinoplanes toevensis]
MTSRPAKRAPAKKAATPKKAAPTKRAPRKAAPNQEAATPPPPATANPAANPAIEPATKLAAEPAANLVAEPAVEPAPAATPPVIEAPSVVEASAAPSATVQAEPTPTATPAVVEAPADPVTNGQAESTPTATSAAVERPAANVQLEPTATAEPANVEDSPVVAGERTDPWAQLVADPGHAPELLALAAVQTFGPKARDWAAQIRESYPAADDRAVARLAKQQFTRFGSVGGIVGAVAGSYAPITLLGTTAVTHAELVLHLAAAYGLDPTDPERAADLLVITRVHPTRSDAEEALAAARRPAYEDGGLSDAVWRFGRLVAAQAGGWTVLRLANRFFPGTSLLAAVLTSTASAQSVAARAEAYYKAARTPA